MIGGGFPAGGFPGAAAGSAEGAGGEEGPKIEEID